MFLMDFDRFLIWKLKSIRQCRKWIPINVFANSPKNAKKRRYIEITEDHYLLIKGYCKEANIAMKDFQWLVVDMGFDKAVEHITEVKNRIRTNHKPKDNFVKTKKKKWWFF